MALTGSEPVEEPTLGPDIGHGLAEQLRRQYKSVVDEGVPDWCHDLLKRLDDRSGGDR